MIIATDLDRTLLPNGKQEYDNTMHIFKKILAEKHFVLIFVTGRNLGEIESAITEFKTPSPEYLVAEVGTRIYSKNKEGFTEDKQWIDNVKSQTENWDIKKFKDSLADLGLRLQEEDHQNQFKLSYYIDNLDNSDAIVKETTHRIKKQCAHATIVYSIDEVNSIGLLDILPVNATKYTALEYLRKKLNTSKDDTVYCGDSGNDILPLTSGYKAILVRNAIEKIRVTVKELMIQEGRLDNLYIAKGYKKFNGYYVSGIIEGLIKHGLIDESNLE